jgi:4'-phosphopantetheinyl transferase superfamily
MTAPPPRLRMRIRSELPAGSTDSLIAGFACDCGIAGQITMARDSNGKPFLLSDGRPASIGMSISHARGMGKGHVAIAIIEQHDVGIDIEHMDQPPTDAAFQASIACLEDNATCRLMTQAGLDAGRSLWCLKEAALKCSGAVMTDPRDLAVRYRGKLWQVRPSRQASAPTPDMAAGLYRLTDTAGSSLFLAIALRTDAGHDMVSTLQSFRQLFHMDNPGWTIAALADGVPSLA